MLKLVCQCIWNNFCCQSALSCFVTGSQRCIQNLIFWKDMGLIPVGNMVSSFFFVKGGGGGQCVG